MITIIYPFNWPLAILAASLPYALMAGNTVVVKPPPTTPLSSVRTLRHLVRALPPGVLNVVTGADEVVGPVVVSDPRVKHGTPPRHRTACSPRCLIGACPRPANIRICR